MYREGAHGIEHVLNPALEGQSAFPPHIVRHTHCERLGLQLLGYVVLVLRLTL